MARMGDRRGAYRVLMGKLRERDRLEDLDVDRTILKSLLGKSVGKTWTRLIWLWHPGSCKHGNEPPGYT